MGWSIGTGRTPRIRRGSRAEARTRRRADTARWAEKVRHQFKISGGARGGSILKYALVIQLKFSLILGFIDLARFFAARSYSTVLRKIYSGRRISGTYEVHDRGRNFGANIFLGFFGTSSEVRGEKHIF